MLAFAMIVAIFYLFTRTYIFNSYERTGLVDLTNGPVGTRPTALYGHTRCFTFFLLFQDGMQIVNQPKTKTSLVFDKGLYESE